MSARVHSQLQLFWLQMTARFLEHLHPSQLQLASRSRPQSVREFPSPLARSTICFCRHDRKFLTHTSATASKRGKVGGPVFELNHHPNPKSHLILASLGVLAALFVLTSPSAAQPQEPKRVLLLMQEDVSWPAFRLIDADVRDT